MTEPTRVPSLAAGSECRRSAARAAVVLPEDVSAGLRVVIDSVFGARLPMFVAWGRELRIVYNDACAALLGDCHPAAFGQPLAQVGGAAWTGLAPFVAAALEGEAALLEDLRFHVQRDGHETRRYVTLSASPVHEGGAIVAACCILTDTTARVLAEQQHRFQLQLAATLRELLDPLGIMDAACALLGRHLAVGLALVKKLVELHGGTVAAHSAGVGLGSVFTIELPLGPAAGNGAGQAGRPHSLEPAAYRPLRVIIVDDNEDAADSLATLLRAQGHTVLVEYTAAAALRRAASELPDAMVVDIGLPDMDGYQLAQRLRRQDGTRDAVLIAATGYGGERDRERAREAGFAHHLVKPVDMAALVRILQSVASGRAEQ